MYNSETGESIYNMFTRPYPTVEEYQVELKSFADAGCEVRFSSPRGSHVCEMRACHQALNISFDVRISNECRENPEAMKKFLQEAWQNVKQELEKKKASLGQV